MSKVKNVCVFCGASNAIDPKFFEMGKQFGRLMVANDLRLVYGGGDCGVMGAVANSVLKEQGWVTGVFPRSLRNIESEHASLSEIILVDTMHERKARMFDLADVFVVLPGGFGTMDEMFEILTWRQLQMHHKPIIICNFEHYWDTLIDLMDNIIEQKFAHPSTAGFFHEIDTIEGVIEYITTL